MVFDATRIASTCVSPYEAPLHRAHDLIHVHRLQRAVALANVHDGHLFPHRETGREVGKAGLYVGIVSEAWPWMNLLGLRSVAKKQRNASRERENSRCHLASPRRRERIFPRQVFGLCRFNPTRRTSQSSYESSVIVGVRTCLPLRGSSGFSPDSLFTLLIRRNLGMNPLYLGLHSYASPLVVDFSYHYRREPSRRSLCAIGRPLGKSFKATGEKPGRQIRSIF